jgi:hypothetical protein
MHALARPCHFSARDRSRRTRRARGWAAGLACRHDTYLLGQSCPRIRRRALHTLPRPSSGALHLAKARGTARARPRALHCTLATSTDASATLWPKFSRRVSLMGDDRQHAPATLRNRDFILDVLRDVLPTTGVILEIASGSGEHVVHFAKCFPRLVFQPSDPDLDARFSIAAWTRAAGVENVHAPIAPRRVGTCLANRIGRRDHLQYPYGSPLYPYGPYLREGSATAPSNQAVERSLAIAIRPGVCGTSRRFPIAHSVGFSTRYHRNACKQSGRGVPPNVIRVRAGDPPATLAFRVRPILAADLVDLNCACRSRLIDPTSPTAQC